MIILEILNHTHPIWGNVFFYIFVFTMLCFIGMLMILLRVLKKKSSDINSIQLQHVARIDNVRKENENKLDNIRVEMLKREEERTRQWMESEKETLRVLNGVSNLLDLEDKFDKNRLNEISKVVFEIREKVDKLVLK